MRELPETKYAQSGDVSIAYQVFGEGPIDLVVAPGSVSHIELNWEQPLFARQMWRLASFARVILFDKRGTGLSDRAAGIPTLEERIDDIRSVMDAAGSERAALMGISEGGPMCILFAATHPDRTSALILYGTYSRTAWAPDYPWGASLEGMEERFERTRQEWGTLEFTRRRMKEWLAPSMADDPAFVEWAARACRSGASPGAVVALHRMNRDIDVRDALPSIHVPTLVLRRENDKVVGLAEVRYLADRIPGAKLVRLPGVDHLTFVGDSAALADEIEEFLTGQREDREVDRVLATVMFTDIVDSTRHATEVGDRRWKELLADHDTLSRREIERFRGRPIKSTGDGVLATFDGPVRAIRCACAIRDSLRTLGIDIRAGLHTGEIELRPEDISGIAVNIASRILDQAGAREVWVSRTVNDLVAGSELKFENKGSHNLKGIESEWQLFSVK